MRMNRIEPGPGQESVWDYPRPPAVVKSKQMVEVRLNDHLIGSTTEALRVIETSHPPTFYLPPSDISADALISSDRRSVCEWKGEAVYFDVVAGGSRVESGAWSYPEPMEGYFALSDHVAFYPALFDCRVDGERVVAQPGSFYGGWVTSGVVGPFKGEPDSWGW